MEHKMTIEEAIKMALEYETRVRDSYVTAAANASSQVGKKVFTTLGEEEQGHIDYLECRLKELQDTGKINVEVVESIVPSAAQIEIGVQKLDEHLSKEDHGGEGEFLSKALQLEKETSDFYQRMVDELGADGEVFEQFLNIEKGHLAIVQAEMDALNQTGYLFDFQDFGMV
jgi:rubrerythrin